MGKRSGLYVFFLFLFLSIIVLFQVLSMMQSDRLFERVNRLEKTVQNMGTLPTEPAVGAAGAGATERGARDPNEGDWLVWNLNSEPATLNPLTKQDLVGSYVLEPLIFEGLLEYDLDTLDFKMRLAESYSIAPDGLSLVFKIKANANFSDGQPVTADDVVFSFNAIKDPNVDAPHLATYYVNFDRIEKLDEKTVRFVLKQKYFKAIEQAGMMSIMPKHIYGYKYARDFNKIRSNPIGSGPYIFEKWEVGRQIVLRRNERYWGERSKLDRIVFKVITNDIASIQSLRAGEVDYVEPTAEVFVDLQNDKTFTAKTNCLKYWSPASGYSYVGWNNATVFFNDKKVRLAMTYLVDRDAIVKYISKGISMVVATPFYPYGKQNDPNIKPWPFDPKKAVALLDEAGWKDTNGNGIRDKNGVEFKFKITVVSGTPAMERIAKLIKDQAAKVGIDVSLDPYEWSVFLEKLNNREFDAYIASWGGVVESDPYQIFHSSQAVKRGSNALNFRNVEVDKLIEEARTTLDEDKRNAIYHKFARVLHEEQPCTFLVARPQLRFLDKRFENVIIHKLGLDEREWFVPKGKQKY